MISTKLRDITVLLLKNRPATLKLKDVAEQTKIPEGWLKMFVCGRILEPSVNRVETIYEYLTKSKLIGD